MKIHKQALSTLGAASLLLQCQAAMAQPQPQSPTHSGNTSAAFNLAATSLSLSAPNHPVNIKIGGIMTAVSSGQHLTPAELMAVSQVINTGHQTLLLGAMGNATGGQFNVMAELGNTLGSLAIPHGVSALANFSSTNSLNLSGDLLNAGTLYLYSSTANHSGAINAANIINEGGSIITSTLPGVLASSLGSKGNFSFQLNALNNISNAGSIVSSGNLALHAGGSITNLNSAGGNSQALMQANANLNLDAALISNGGKISSVTGNINISSPNQSSIVINNSGGELSALKGDINIGEQQSSADSNFNLTGGSIVSNNLNIYSGTGTVDVSSTNLSAVINVYAGQAHVDVNSPDLKLGVMDLSGDPTFYNQNGNITISEPLSFSGQNLALVASGNIICGPGATVIDTSSNAGNGGAISLIAGAKFTLSPQSLPGSNLPSSGNNGDASNTDTLSITGSSATGGFINLSGPNGITKLDSSATGAAGNGGTIQLVALAGSSAGSGAITLPSALAVTSSAPNFAGRITLMSTANSGAGIQAGSLIAQGATAGTIGLSCEKITLNSVTVTNGAVNGGFFFGAYLPASISDSGSITGDTVSVVGGSSIAVASIQANGLTISGGSTSNSNIQFNQAVNVTNTAIIATGGNGSITTGNTAAISAGNLVLTASTGSIGRQSSPLNVGSTAHITAATGIAGNPAFNGKSNVFISGDSAISIDKGNAGPGGTFSVSTSSGTLSVNGSINIINGNGLVTLNSGSSSSDGIVLNGNINNQTGTVTLTTNANSTTGITSSSGTITSGTVNINPGSGSAGNLFAPINSAASIINVGSTASITNQSIGLSNTGNMTLSILNTVGTLTVECAGSINVNGNLTASTLFFLNSTAGSISANGLLSSNAASGIILGASQSIGSAAAPINFSAGPLQVNATGGSAYLNSQNSVSLGTSSAGGSFQLLASGNIVIPSGGGVTGANISLSASPFSGGSISIGSNIGSATSNVLLQADGVGTISESGGAGITAVSANFYGGSGNIAASVLSAPNISFHSTGPVQFTDSISTTIGASSAGSLLGSAFGNISTGAPVSSQTILLVAKVGSNGSINVNSSLGTQGGTVVLQADGTGNISTSPAGLILGTQVNLTTASGSIGDASHTVNIAGGGTLTITTGATSFGANISSAAGITVNSTTTASMFLVAGGNITASTSIPSDNLIFRTSTGSNGNITIENGATLGTSAGSLALEANGTGNIVTSGTGSILGFDVYLTSGTGNIGNASTGSINTSVQDLQVNTGGSGTVAINNNCNCTITLTASNAGGNFQLASNNSIVLQNWSLGPYAIYTNGGSIAVSSTSGSIQLAANSTLSATGNSAANPGNISLLTANSASIVLSSQSAIYADGVVNILVGNASGQGVAPASNFFTIGGTAGSNGIINYGSNNGIVTVGPSNTVVALGTATNTAQVTFSAPNAVNNAITLGGDVTVASTTFGHLSSLDLSNHAVASAVNSINALDPSNTSNQHLTVSATGGATGGSATLDPWDLAQSVSAFNIPTNTTLNLRGFFAQNAISVNLSSSSTSPRYTVSGNENIISSNLPGLTNSPVILAQTISAQTSGLQLVAVNSSGKISETGASGSQMSLTANGGFVINGPISSTGNISLGALNGVSTFTLGANISGALNGSISIQSAGNLIQNAGSITGGAITLSSYANLGSSTAPIKISASTFQIASAQNAFVSSSGASDITGLPSNGNVTIISAQDIDLAGNAQGVNNLTLEAAPATKNMNIFVSTPVGTAQSNITMTAKGNGEILDPSGGSNIIYGTNVLLVSGTGGIGTNSTVTTAASNSLSAKSTGSSSIFLYNINPTTLKASSAGNVFSLGNSGNLTVTGAVSAITTNLLCNTGNLTIEASVGMAPTSTAPNTSTTLQNATGTITMSAGSFRVLGATLNIGGAGSSGDIGDTPGILRTSVTTLNLNTSGNVSLLNSSNQLTLNSSNTSLSLNLNTSGSLTLASSAYTNGAVTIQAGGSILSQNTAGFSGTSVSLTSGGSIELAGAPGNFLPLMLTANNAPLVISAKGSAFINISGAQSYNLEPSTATGTLSIAGFSSTSVVLDGKISAPTLDLLSGNNITIAGTIGAVNGTTSLITNGAGDIGYSSGVVQGTNVSLTVGGANNTGSIGSSPATAVQTNATNLSVKLNANASGSIFVNNISKAPLNISSATVDTGELDIITNGTTTVAGPITAGANSTTYLTVLGGGNLNIANSINGAAGSNIEFNIAEAGNITMKPNTAPISVPQITIATSAGNIGSSSSNVLTAANQLSVFNEGNGYVSNLNAAGVVLAGGGGTGSMQLLSSGPISSNGAALSYPTLTLQTTANNAGITLSGNVGESGPSVTLIANGNGSITQTSGLVLAKTVVLSSGSGNIGSFSAPITTLYTPVLGGIQALTANSGAGSSIYINDQSLVMNLGASNAGNSLQVIASGQLNTTAAVSAPSVNLSAGTNQNLTIGGNIGQAIGSTTLNSNGTGNIVAKAGTLLGTTVTLNSQSNIGTSSTNIKTATFNLGANATGSVYVTNTLSGANGLTILDSSAGDNFQITANNSGQQSTLSLLLNNISTNQGSITAIANNGVLVLQQGAALNAANGNITLQNTNSSNGSIDIANNATISALLQSKQAGHLPTIGGNVFAFIGSTQPKGINTVAPANVTQTLSGGGSVFYGKNSITAPTFPAVAVIKAEGSNVTFSTGTRPASAITVSANVTITADPPVAAAAPLTLAAVGSTQHQASLGSSESSLLGQETLANNGRTTQMAGVIAIDLSSAGGAHSGAGSGSANTVLPTLLTTNSPPSTIFGSTLASSYAPGIEVHQGTGAGAGDAAQDVAVETGYPTDSPLKGSISMRDRNPGNGIVQDLQALPTTGTGLYRGRNNSSELSPNCSISARSGSLVYIDRSHSNTAILNLSDRSNRSVVVTLDGHEVELAPGQALIISESKRGEFAEINPLEAISYRGIEQVTAKKRVFVCDFSIFTALRSVPALQSLLKSSNLNDLALRNQLFKTAAALTVAKPGVPYIQYRRIPLISSSQIR